MKHIKLWIKVFTLLLFSSLFGTSIYAVDITLDNTISEITGDGDPATCLTGDIYRLGTNATYNGQALDIIVEITDEDNEYDELETQDNGNCITINSGVLSAALRDRDAGDDLAYMDLKVTVVEQGQQHLYL